MSLINIRVLSFKFLVDCWDVFIYGRGWPHASQVCCDRHQGQKIKSDKIEKDMDEKPELFCYDVVKDFGF